MDPVGTILHPQDLYARLLHRDAVCTDLCAQILHVQVPRARELHAWEPHAQVLRAQILHAQTPHLEMLFAETLHALILHAQPLHAKNLPGTPFGNKLPWLGRALLPPAPAPPTFLPLQPSRSCLC